MRIDVSMLKAIYGVSLISLLIIQVIVINALFIAIFMGIVEPSDKLLHMYLKYTSAALFGLVYLVTRSIFNATDSKK